MSWLRLVYVSLVVSMLVCDVGVGDGWCAADHEGIAISAGKVILEDSDRAATAAQAPTLAQSDAQWLQYIKEILRRSSSGSASSPSSSTTSSTSSSSSTSSTPSSSPTTTSSTGTASSGTSSTSSGTSSSSPSTTSSSTASSSSSDFNPSVPQAGGLVAPQTGGGPSANLLDNPDFLNGTNGWSINPNCFAIDTSVLTPSGHPTLRLTNANTCSGGAITTNDYIPTGPGTFNLSGWIMTSNVSCGTNNDQGVRISMYGANGGDPPNLICGNTNWTQMTINGITLASGQSVPVRLEAYNAPSGTAWFGDIVLTQQLPPPLSVFLLYPNFRGMMFDAWPQTIKLAVTVNPPSGTSLSQLQVRVTVTDSSGAVRLKQDLAAASNVVATLDASRLPYGAYDVQAALLNAQNGSVVATQSPYLIYKLNNTALSSLKAYIGPDNVAFFGGRRRFVMGTYDTSGYSNSPSFWDQEFAPFGSIGLNAYINYWLSGEPISTMDVMTTELEKFGMYYLPIMNLFYPSNTTGTPTFQQLLQEFGGTNEQTLVENYAGALSQNSGIMGYYMQDEPPTSLEPETFQQYGYIKAADPGSISFAVLNQPAAFAQWRDALDALGSDPYPIYLADNNPSTNLAQVGDWTAQEVQSVMGARPVWTVIQFFQFTCVSGWPTAQELHDMSWMAITEGALGLFYWSVGVGGIDGGQCPPPQWNANETFYNNQFVLDPNGGLEQASAPPTGGKTGSTQPQWPKTIGGTVQDGGVTWTLVATNMGTNGTQAIFNYMLSQLSKVTMPISQMEPVLLSPDDNSVLSGVSPSGVIHFKTKDVNNVRYVFAYNHSNTPLQATFSLTTSATSVTVYGENRSLALSGTSFSDAFNPFQAHVYIIQ